MPRNIIQEIKMKQIKHYFTYLKTSCLQPNTNAGVLRFEMAFKYSG